MRAAKGHAKHRASGAAWVAKSKCCQLRQTKSTMLAAIGHAKHRVSGAAWVAVSKRCQLKSIINSLMRL